MDGQKVLFVRCSPELHSRLTAAAKTAGQSLNEFCVSALSDDQLVDGRPQLGRAIDQVLDALILGDSANHSKGSE